MKKKKKEEKKESKQKENMTEKKKSCCQIWSKQMSMKARTQERTISNHKSKQEGKKRKAIINWELKKLKLIAV